MKYKLEYTDGCVCTGLNVNDLDWNDLTPEERYSICQKILKTKDEYIMQQMFMTFVSSHGDYEDLGYCEECGDSIDRWTIEIE